LDWYYKRTSKDFC